MPVKFKRNMLCFNKILFFFLNNDLIGTDIVYNEQRKNENTIYYYVVILCPSQQLFHCAGCKGSM